MANSISVTILTKNSEKYLHECLSALVLFDEIIILDNGSTDDTLNIAKSFHNVKLYEHTFIGFGALKNLALTYTSNDWILCVDSDEILDEALVKEVLNVHLEVNTIYSLLRKNYYNKKLMPCCGWENDYVNRLFNKTFTKFNEKHVHESLITTHAKLKKLKNTFKHYSFSSAEELVAKMQHYSTLYANEHKHHKTASPFKAFFRALFTFIKNYFFQKGFLYGYEGFVISISNANGTFYKYIKLYEANKNDV